MLIAYVLIATLLSAEQQLALQMLSDVAIRNDVAGIELARQRIAGTPGENARRQYLLAVADYHLAMALFADRPRAKDVIVRASETLDKVLVADPDFVEALAFRSRLDYFLLQYGVLDRKAAMTRMKEVDEKTMKLAPDDPLVLLDHAAMIYYGGDHPGGMAIMRKAIDGFAARAAGDPHAAMWLPYAWNWLGLLYMTDGELESAHDALETALKVRPDFTYVRTAMMPMTQLAETVAPPSGERKWTTLVSDAEGDGRAKQGNDLRAVEWSRDGDAVWFRCDLAAPVDPARVGVNLALDVDGDPANGNNWWAGNTAFKYDRLVSVWVGRGHDGKYRGSVGAANAADVTAGRYTTLPHAPVAFAIDKAIYVRVDRNILGDHPRVVATVGTNTDWNDVAPGEGAATLELAPR